jgi:hypothetical protein
MMAHRPEPRSEEKAPDQAQGKDPVLVVQRKRKRRRKRRKIRRKIRNIRPRTRRKRKRKRRRLTRRIAKDRRRRVEAGRRTRTTRSSRESVGSGPRSLPDVAAAFPPFRAKRRP